MRLPPERLEPFYLGANFDVLSGNGYGSIPLGHDVRDLTPHAVNIGMTGSGKARKVR
jgi:hypothetical protein